MSSENNSIVVEDLSQKIAPVQPVQDTKVVEPVVEEQPQVEVKDKKEELFSSKFANLTRKEREILKKEQELKALQDKYSKYEELAKEPKQNVSKVLESLGLSLQDVIDHALNQAEAEALEKDDSPEGKIRKLEQKLQQFETKEQEKERLAREAEEKRVQQQIDETISTFKSEISSFIEKNAETYELIAAQEATESVFEVIEENFNRTGKVMSIEEAATLVENYLEEEAKKILSRSKKLKSALPSESVESPAEEELKVSPSQPQQEKKMAPTLTATATPSTAVVQNTEVLSREESLRRAAAKLQWKK